MEKPNWIVVANAARARVLEQGDGPVRYAHVADLVPHEARSRGVQAGGSGTGLKDSERAEGVGADPGRDVDAPRTELHDLEQDHFAREVAHAIADGVARGRCAGVTLVACDPFLGQIEAHLDAHTRKALRRTPPGDFTVVGDDELARRLQQG